MLVTSRRTIWLFAIGLVFPLIVATSELPRQDAGQRITTAGQLSRSDQVPGVQTAGEGQSQGTLGGTVAQAQTAPGTTGAVVVEEPPASGSTPSLPQYQVVTPTPGTGSTVVVQPPASGSAPSVPEYQVVIPGPNPSQNTGVGLGEQVGTPGNPVTVYPTPGP